MRIFKFFRKEKKKPEQLIREFEIGRRALLQKVKEVCDDLRSKGYNVLELIPLIASVGKAEKKKPFGIMLVVTSELFKKFHEYVDMGEYSNNQLKMFYVGDYAFLLITARDDNKKLAICYSTAFRRKHVKKIQGKDTLYIYIIDGQTSKYSLIYFKNVRWGVAPEVTEDTLKSQSKNEKPPSTPYW
ncbi:MAG: hypothetical protein DRJ26_02950 [Candidatus Methanomethylicota archaeon]|uniref:Uncharacterized protein n=1 Tax=Thermoproteota archaeon TaxID=2056631 RepID=A0A497F2V1_9CREN|nr:MAG: hypothetical protein DRJ26_02950 [Candidatus Verstraetearchaeota archaeon]